MKPITGSIYVTKDHKKGGKGVAYCAELNYRGLRIRKSSTDRAVCEDWLADIVAQINAAVQEKNQVVRAASEAERRKIEAIIAKAQLADMRYRNTAIARGIRKTGSYQTYLLYNPCSGLYKIGKSKDIYARLGSFCVPEIKLLAYLAKDIERQLHIRYAQRRQLGEWFELNEADLWELSEDDGFIFVE